MNRFHSIFYCIMIMMFFIGCNKNRVVLNPEYDSNIPPPSSYGLDRIELSDSATVFDITLYNLPGFWTSVEPSIRLEGEITGKEYSLKWIEGLAPDIMIHMDSSGFFPTKLFFEPVDPADSIINLIENNKYHYKGIKLYDVSQGKIKTHVSGKLNAFGASWLIMERIFPSQNSKSYVIPVRNGEFSYDIFTDEPIVFKVYIGKELLEGIIKGMPLFWAEGGNVILDFKDNSSKTFMVEGGILNKELKDFIDSYEFFKENHINNYPELKRYKWLEDNNKLYVPEYYELYKELEKEQEGWKRQQLNRRLRNLWENDSIFSVEGREAYRDLYLYDEIHSDSLEYLKEEYLTKAFSTPSLTHLYYIFSNLWSVNSNLDLNLERFNNWYTDTFTNSSYHKYIKELADLIAPEIGNHFINFNLPDLTGKYYSLSDIIEGKPCLLIFESEPLSKETLNELIELYRKFKPKGLEIVSIVLKSDSFEGANKLKSYDFPWHVLFDDKDKEGVWRKYRMGHQKFKIFLINEKGIINNINPSKNDIMKFLDEKNK